MPERLDCSCAVVTVVHMVHACFVGALGGVAAYVCRVADKRNTQNYVVFAMHSVPTPCYTSCMQIKTGIDIVHVPTFERSLQAGGDSFHSRVFSEQDSIQRPDDVAHLSGLFAAKEAAMKAVGDTSIPLHGFVVGHMANGKPTMSLPGDVAESTDVSIAHHGDYSVATVVVLYA